MIKIRVSAELNDFEKIKELLKEYKVDLINNKNTEFNITEARKKLRQKKIKEHLIFNKEKNYSVEKLYNVMRRQGKYSKERKTFTRDLKDLEMESFIKINILSGEGVKGRTSEVIVL